MNGKTMNLTVYFSVVNQAFCVPGTQLVFSAGINQRMCIPLTSPDKISCSQKFFQSSQNLASQCLYCTANDYGMSDNIYSPCIEKCRSHQMANCNYSSDGSDRIFCYYNNQICEVCTSSTKHLPVYENAQWLNCGSLLNSPYCNEIDTNDNCILDSRFPGCNGFQNQNICSSCKFEQSTAQQFFLEAGKCIHCQQRHPRCSNCSSDGSCIQCFGNYQLAGGECKALLDCPLNYSLIDGKCICVGHAVNGQCILCDCDVYGNMDLQCVDFCKIQSLIVEDDPGELDCGEGSQVDGKCFCSKEYQYFDEATKQCIYSCQLRPCGFGICKEHVCICTDGFKGRWCDICEYGEFYNGKCNKYSRHYKGYLISTCVFLVIAVIIVTLILVVRGVRDRRKLMQILAQQTNGSRTAIAVAQNQ